MGDLARYGVELGALQISNPRTGPYVLSDLDIGGKPESANQDKSRPREDGVFFGRDLLSTGRLIKLAGSVSTRDGETGRRAWEALVQAWDARTTRQTPGAVLPLRLRVGGGPVRTVFGRPRELDPVSGIGLRLLERGRVDFTAQWRCVDHLLYDDVEQNVAVGIATAGTPGLRCPLRSPLTSRTTGRTAAPGTVDVGGTEAAWPAITFWGPIVNPTWNDLGGGHLTLAMSLASDEYVQIITAPWDRGVLLNGAIDVPGALTQDSMRLSQARLDPGLHRVVLRGQDPTGTARMSTVWRNAYETI